MKDFFRYVISENPFMGCAILCLFAFFGVIIYGLSVTKVIKKRGIVDSYYIHQRVKKIKPIKYTIIKFPDGTITYVRGCKYAIGQEVVVDVRVYKDSIKNYKQQ